VVRDTRSTNTFFSYHSCLVSSMLFWTCQQLPVFVMIVILIVAQGSRIKNVQEHAAHSWTDVAETGRASSASKKMMAHGSGILERGSLTGQPLKVVASLLLALNPSLAFQVGLDKVRPPLAQQGAKHLTTTAGSRHHYKDLSMMASEAAESSSPAPVGFFLQDATKRVACSAGAAATTWTLIERGLDSVSASSVVGLAAGIVAPAPLATAAFCGSFAGMSSRVVAPGPADAAALGGAAAALLAALDASNTRLLKGIGGRLGSVAALAAFASVAATPSLRAAGLLYQPSLSAAAAAPRTLFTTISATMLGSAATRLWARRLAVFLAVGPSSMALSKRLSNPVASASVVGLAMSLAFGPSRKAVSASVFAGAFVAMSAPDKLGSTRSLLGAAALAGFAQAGLASIGVGVGGKLGAAASIGVVLARSIRAAAASVLLIRGRARPRTPPS